MTTHTEEERRQEIRTAVMEMLFLLGIDTSTPEAIRNFRKDLNYVREWRESVEEVKRKGLLTSVVVLVTGFIGWLLMSLPGQHS